MRTHDIVTIVFVTLMLVIIWLCGFYVGTVVGAAREGYRTGYRDGYAAGYEEEIIIEWTSYEE